MRTNNLALSRGFAKRDMPTLFRIMRAMNECKGSLEQTARKLNIDKWTLKRWIDKEPRLAEAYRDARVEAIGGTPEPLAINGIADALARERGAIVKALRAQARKARSEGRRLGDEHLMVASTFECAAILVEKRGPCA